MAPQASKKCGLLPPITIAYRFLHKQWHQFGKCSWHHFTLLFLTIGKTLGQAAQLFIVLVLLSNTLSCTEGAAARHTNNKSLDTEFEPTYIPGELLVTFKEGIPESRMNTIHESLNVQVLRRMFSGRVHLVRVDRERSLNEARKAYLNFPEVQAVDFNDKIQAQ